jgi:hypothetical protein
VTCPECGVDLDELDDVDVAASHDGRVRCALCAEDFAPVGGCLVASKVADVWACRCSACAAIKANAERVIVRRSPIGGAS